MPIRLRQTYTVSGFSVTGTLKTLSTGKVVAATPLGGILCNGFGQWVEDNWEPPNVKVRYRPRKRNIVPPLNSVRMTKLELPFYTEPINYKAVGGGYDMRLSGVNLAMYPQSRYASFNFKVPTMSFVSVDQKVYGYLLQRAYSKMSSAEYDFGVTIAEVAETAAFLAGPLAGIVKLSSAAFAGIAGIRTIGLKTYAKIAKNATAKQIRMIKQSSVAHPSHSSIRILNESANHWLAYKFGVLPLIEDVQKAMDFKENNITRLTGLQCARVSGPPTDETTVEAVKDQYVYGGYLFTSMIVRRYLHRYHCGLYFRNKINAPLVNFVENLGFAPWQLPSLAWEVIPLSFVVDRFIDIKSFIRGNVGSLTKDTYGSFCTRKDLTTHASTVHQIKTNFGVKLIADQPLNSVTKFSQMARAVNLQRPNFPVVNPHWQSQLTADATNLALIWSRLRTHVSKQLR